MDALVGVVTGEETAINRDGSVPGRILQCVVTDLSDGRTAETFQGGEEYNPPPGCRIVMIEAGLGYKLVVAVDDGHAPVMTPGGKRLYSLDAAGANIKADFRLGPDGTVSVTNAGGSFTMSPAGVFTFHGTGSTFDHAITCTDVIFNSISAASHMHTNVQPGSGDTGGPTS